MFFSLKSKLRKKYLKKRKLISFEDVSFLSEKIFEQYLLKFKPSKNQNIHIFLPITSKNEINTNLWIDFFWKNGINVFIPKLIGNHIISCSYTPNTKLVINTYGIAEPESDINVKIEFNQIIVPLLYADVNGNRIGYGKGFYDRFLGSIDYSAQKIGINYFSPKDLILDVDQFDIKIDYLVLPDRILSFMTGPLKSTK